MQSGIAEQGSDAIAFWERVVRTQPDIAALAIFYYTPQPLLQRRLPSNGQEQAVIARALTIAERSRIPFWDAVLLEALQNDGLTDPLLEATSLSHPVNIEPILIERRALLDGELRACVATAGSDKVTALLSEAIMDTGAKMHFPMLDFRCQMNPANLNAVNRIARRLLPAGGTLLSTGRSYHAVGKQLVHAERLQGFLIDSLFYCPIVDRQYVAHHLRRGLCTLRISANGCRAAPSTVAKV